MELDVTIKSKINKLKKTNTAYFHSYVESKIKLIIIIIIVT
jgi:hypothetical protein